MVNSNLWSSSLESIPWNEVSHPIQIAVLEIQREYKLPTIVLYKYKDGYEREFSVLSLTIRVHLPSKGVFDGIEIFEEEPILIFFNSLRYPIEAPQIRTNRINFPTASLPHLNPVLSTETAWLCLYRGHINDWFVHHSILDLIERAAGWLEDATKGHLIKENDRFEATRIDYFGYCIGVSIFSQKCFVQYITESWKNTGKSGSAFVRSFLKAEEITFAWMKIYSDFLALNLEEVFPKGWGNSQNRANPYQSGTPTIGVLCWADKTSMIWDYFGSLPDTISGLFSFAEMYGIDLRGIVAILEKNGAVFIPVFLCIQRPKLLIGSDNQLEIITFIITPQLEGKKEKGVIPLPHRDPLTTDFARSLSNVSKIICERIALIGCGALGSKIGLHLAREGITNLTLIDNDTLSPHNLVRHALLADHIGSNKAQALEKVIRGIFAESPGSLNLQSKTVNVFDLLKQPSLLASPREEAYLIDATASSAVLQALSKYDNPNVISIIRTEIADEGRFGIMLIEGRRRNPRIDDLTACLYTHALEDKRLEEWLINAREIDDEIGAHLEDIPVGLGCSSPTMKMSDDVISFHAASSARTIRKIVSDEGHKSGIQLSYMKDTGFQPEYKVEFIGVENFSSLTDQISGWNVRIKGSIVEKMIDQAKKSAPNETGGILVGQINKKAKTIYITRLLAAPSDSKGTPYSFKMGLADVPDKINEIAKKTNGIIDYAGEWHSHPNNSGFLSPQDMEAKKQLESVLKKYGLITHLLVVTPKGCFSYVWE